MTTAADTYDAAMSISRGRGKANTLELKKDEKQTWAGTKLSSNAALSNTLVKTPSVGSLSNTESAMDDYLAKLNLYRKPVAKDGSCLFRVVSEQIYNTQAKHIQVRFECIDFMRKEKQLFEAFVEGSYEHHLYSLKNPKEWGGQVEISALSLLYQRDFIVYQSVNMEPQAVTCNNFKKKILLCYSNGNHYDAVYPLTFKTNAALAQALIYDIILDNTFQEIETRQEMREYEASKNENGADDWTEVKNKQKEIKARSMEENNNNRVNCVFPESANNQKIYWQLKRSFDTTYYRNIELEVWEDYRADITKNDYALAASMQQLRPGEVCLATIKEAKDVSEIIRVKIHEINPDKCIVYSEDEKTRYYVQLYDLQPLPNDDDDSYKHLPGYYNKLDEKDSEFQHQKRRGKGGKKYRDDESKKSEHPVRAGDINKRQDQRTNGRRNIRGIDKKRDLNEKVVSSPTVRRVKSDQDIKRNDKSDDINRNMVTSPDDPTKIAKPAETAAAFWGRMRTTKTVGASTNGSPTNSKTPSPVDVSSNPIEPQPKVASPLIHDAPLLSNLQREPESKKAFPVASNPDKSSHNANTQIIKDSKKPAWGVIRNPVEPQTTAHLPKSNSDSINNVAKNVVDSTDNSNSSTTVDEPLILHKKEIVTEETNSPLENPADENIVDIIIPSDQIIVSNSPDSSINKFTQQTSKEKQFNFTSQDSLAKINEVRENILAKSAKMTIGNFENNELSSDDSSSYTTDDQNCPPILTPDQGDVAPLGQSSTNSIENTIPEVQAPVSSDDTVNTVAPVTSHNPTNENTETIIQSDISHEMSNAAPSPYIAALTKPNEVVSSTFVQANAISPEPKLSNGDISRPPPLIETIEKPDDRQDRGKKRVSFGTTQIIDNQQHIVTHVPIDISTSISSHGAALSEPGKIVLPPEHIEKHQNEFTSGIHATDVHAHAQQQPHFVQSFMPASPALPIYQPVQGIPVFRMAYNSIAEHPSNNILTPVISYDPEGKDLPDDITILRHFYNLGVQWYYLSQNQQNNYHVTQPGILPAPVQHPIGNTPIRQLLMASESPLIRSVDCYSPNSQTIDTNAHLDQLNHIQQTPGGSTYLANPVGRSNNSINSLPNLNQIQHPTSYEEYELPPRLQRGGGANNRSTNHRPYFPQRPFLSGGRGIIGPNPRHRYPIRTPSHTIY